MDSNNQSNYSVHMSSLFHLDGSHYAVPVNGYLMPLIAAVTLVNNALVLVILMRRQMRSPTNALLIALAVSDTLTCVCPVPCFVYFYTVGQRYQDWVPYSWCFVFFCLTDYFPTVFHTASIWLTASLAVQRYACVCCQVGSTVRRRLCTMRSTVCVIVGVYIAAVASQACRLGELSFSPVQVPSLINHVDDYEQVNVTAVVVEVTACRYEMSAFVTRHETAYYNVYYWSRVLLIHVIPCSALVVLNANLIRTMRAAHHRRRQLKSLPRTTLTLTTRPRTASVTETPESYYEMQLLASTSHVSVSASDPPCRRGSGSDSATRATMMLVTVVGVFLVVEVPLSVLLLFVIIENTFGVDMFSDSTRYTAAVFVNCCIAITYPLNFFIYCAMSQRFRHMFCDIFSRRATVNNATPQLQNSTHRSGRIELD